MNETGNNAPCNDRTDCYAGYTRHIFAIAGCECFLVEPHHPLPRRPWVWKAEFFEAFPTFELAMLATGFHLAYIAVGNTFGCPSAMRCWDAFYEHVAN